MTKPTHCLDVDLEHHHTELDWRGLRLMRHARLLLSFDQHQPLAATIRSISPPIMGPGSLGTAKLLVSNSALPAPGTRFWVETMGLLVISGTIADIRPATDQDQPVLALAEAPTDQDAGPHSS